MSTDVVTDTSGEPPPESVLTSTLNDSISAPIESVTFTSNVSVGAAVSAAISTATLTASCIESRTACVVYVRFKNALSNAGP